jgi:Pyruvate/2-oxoacid:ferredoxin oxidoreductase gamma subunit
MAERMVNIMIGGAAGQGLVTVGQLLTKSLIRAGYETVVRQDYMSRVRGGHNTFAIRTGTCSIKASCETVDILVAMNQETIDLHGKELADDGLVFCDTKLDRGAAAGLSLPLGDLAPKPIFQNVAALGVLASALGIDQSYPSKLLTTIFVPLIGIDLVEGHTWLHDVHQSKAFMVHGGGKNFHHVPYITGKSTGDKTAFHGYRYGDGVEWRAFHAARLCLGDLPFHSRGACGNFFGGLCQLFAGASCYSCAVAEGFVSALL